MRISDWSSDVCSSDLLWSVGDRLQPTERRGHRAEVVPVRAFHVPSEGAELRGEIAQIAHVGNPGVRLDLVVVDDHADLAERSEERRVGKECVSTCRSRWSPYL